MGASMGDLKSLPPHLLNFYTAFFKNFSAGINAKLSSAQATEQAWEQTLASHPLTEAEEKRMRALIELG